MFEYDYDVAVIGGGLLGCFAARNLRKHDMRVVLLEAREDLCTGVSRANTAVVYSGYDTKPGTLKTELCVRGNRDYESLCAQLGVRFSKCGSIMVCFGEKGAEVLRKKLERGAKNGVEGLKLLNREEVLAMEPRLSQDVYMGLYSPTTGTANPWELGTAAGENFVMNGGDIYFNCKVASIKKSGEYFSLIAGDRTIRARGVVNCAGLFADEIMEMVSKPSVRIFPDKCDYLVLDTTEQALVSHIIFYEPEEKEKGLTVVPTVDGNIMIGGTVTDSADKVSNTTTREGIDRVFKLAERLLPGLPAENVIRSFATVRPNPFFVFRDENTGKLVKDDESINNFVISKGDRFISLVGIKTPGLTCADGLGQMAADTMAEMLGERALNKAFRPEGMPMVRFSNATDEQKVKLIRSNPAYGRIVCHCRSVTEAEIVESVHRGAITVDGVKRRTGACMGRCQGEGCAIKIIEIIARELNISPSKVKKDGAGSNMIYDA